MKKKRAAALLLSMTVLISLSACAQNEKEPSPPESNANSSSVIGQQSEKLVNYMSQKEKSSVSVGRFSLLDEDESDTSDSPSDKQVVQIDVWDGNDYLEWIRQSDVKSQFKEEQYNNYTMSYKAMINDDIKSIRTVVIDGRRYSGFMPPYNYDGGQMSYSVMQTASSAADSENNDRPEECKFNNFEEFKPWYREYINKDVSDGLMTQEEADQEYNDMLVIFDSVINKTYEVTDIHIDSIDYSATTDAKNNWEFNASEVSEIIDSVKEISVYDEELDTTFIVHVTLPPDFNKSETYPVFVMTDGVWRFGDHPALRKMMKNKETQDVLLVSIGYDFSIDGTDNGIRGEYFCDKKEQFLNFITDNLMPYLGDEYKIDYEHSTLYGHSLGGVFTHYAAFNSDQYANQPFHNYIIGSPAFWSPYFNNNGEYKSEYGYFDRNDRLEKSIYVSGGENEDADYAQYYGENDSTLEGVSNLMERMKTYGISSVECKIYEGSNHYEYIPEMFRTFFLEYYKK
ncbi:MAG: alpha/beta hydrolase-fold protein [Oscillospiraceae bacterium]|nr:alpha/beta hydrolase-fold protein [Oscillospiraceae bacterium]